MILRDHLYKRVDTSITLQNKNIGILQIDNGGSCSSLLSLS